MVNKKELMNMLLYLDKWTRKNKGKIKQPIRVKHFLEDLSYFLHWLDDDKIHPKIQIWRNESIQRALIKIYGIKKKDLLDEEGVK